MSYIVLHCSGFSLGFFARLKRPRTLELWNFTLQTRMNTHFIKFQHFSKPRTLPPFPELIPTHCMSSPHIPIHHATMHAPSTSTQGHTMDNKIHNISVRLDTLTYTKLSDIARQTDAPLSYVIRSIIKDHLRSTLQGATSGHTASTSTSSSTPATADSWEV